MDVSIARTAEQKFNATPKKEIEVSNFQEASFTNHLGQVINVGDQVITVSTGYCNTVHVRKGMYLGRRGNSPTVQVIEDAWGYVLPNGNVYPHKSPEAEYKKYTRTRRTTLPRGRVYLTR